MGSGEGGSMEISAKFRQYKLVPRETFCAPGHDAQMWRFLQLWVGRGREEAIGVATPGYLV